MGRLRVLGSAVGVSALAAMIAVYPSVANAQKSLDNAGPGTPFNGLPSAIDSVHRGATLRVSVLSEGKSHLDRQALAKLHCDYPQATLYQTTRADSQTLFLDLPIGKYDLEISAVGYISTKQQVDINEVTDDKHLDILLKRDPMAIDIDPSGTADALMSEKASKETRNAVKAFKAGNWKEGQKHLQAAYKMAPDSSRVNFLLGYQSYQQKKFEEARNYLERATALDGNNAQALGLLGRVQLLLGDTAKSKVTLERTVEVNPADWLSQTFLADACFRAKDYEKAREHAALAMENGKTEAASAQLILGEAEANLGQIPEALKSFEAYLQTKPDDTTAKQVQGYITQLKDEQSNPAAPVLTFADTAVPQGLLQDSEPQLASAWQPPGVDEAKPSVAPGVSCPTEDVLKRTGENVERLVENVGRFAAIEDMLHERLDAAGNATSRETRKFDYAANISQATPGYLALDEYRTERYALDSVPDEIVTSGFPALALIFHPSMQGNYEMVCEGLGEWRGQATWLMHFRQREDMPSRIQSLREAGMSYPVNLKGRAWITADKFQIIRLESELVKPMKEVRFMVQHSIAEYGPVQFQKKKVEIWLPKSAEVYLDFRRHKYYRRHSFDHYMLFSVESEQKDKQARREPHGPESTTPRRRRFWLG